MKNYSKLSIQGRRVLVILFIGWVLLQVTLVVLRFYDLRNDGPGWPRVFLFPITSIGLIAAGMYLTGRSFFS